MHLTTLLNICAWVATTAGSSMMYGNDAMAGSSYLPSSGKKTWVDADVMLTYGTLEKFYVYVHNVTTGLLPYLRLQVWTPTGSDEEIRYRLKWQKEVMLTEVDHLYEFDLIQSEKIEVMENDRIGFCSEEDVTPVSMTIGNHRTHFRSIEDELFPVVREEYEFESIAFPAAFAIGVSISDAPLMEGAFFYGNQVIMRSKHMETEAKRVWIDADTHLTNGTLEEFHMYIAPVSGSPVYVRLQLWEADSLSGVNNSFRLVWEKRVELPVNGAQRFVVKLTETGKPQVFATNRLGWTFEDDRGPIYYSDNVNRRTLFYTLNDAYFPDLGDTYAFNGHLAIEFSVAAVIKRGSAKTSTSIPGISMPQTTSRVDIPGSTNVAAGQGCLPAKGVLLAAMVSSFLLAR